MAIASSNWQIGKLTDPKWSTSKRPKERLVGIELEYEHVSGISLGNPHQSGPKVHVTPRWYGVTDGSLRNSGAEFVSIPIPISQVSSALAELFQIPGSAKWQTSIRTGAHVHVDVRDFNLEEFRCTLTGYALSEPALFNYVGLDREENIFCVPWYRAPADLETAVAWLDAKTGPSNAEIYFGHMSKYDALNLMPITKFGTVEFRHAPCTKEQAQIAEWASICVNVVEMGIKYNQNQLLQEYLANPNAFPRNFISPMCHMLDYEVLMLRSNAEWLAHQTLKTREVFDPKDKTQWVRLNDKIVYDPKTASPYLKRKKPPNQFPPPTFQQLVAQQQQLAQNEAQNQAQPAGADTQWLVQHTTGNLGDFSE